MSAFFITVHTTCNLPLSRLGRPAFALAGISDALASEKKYATARERALDTVRYEASVCPHSTISLYKILILYSYVMHKNLIIALTSQLRLPFNL